MNDPMNDDLNNQERWFPPEYVHLDPERTRRAFVHVMWVVFMIGFVTGLLVGGLLMLVL